MDRLILFIVVFMIGVFFGIMLMGLMAANGKSVDEELAQIEYMRKLRKERDEKAKKEGSK